MRGSTLAAWAIALGTMAILLPPSVAPLRGTTITMTVWGQPFEDRLFKDRYARGFEALHPEVEVDYQRHADLEAKYNAWHAHGQGPEIMRMRVTMYHQYVARGMLLPLDGFLADTSRGLTAKELAAFPPQLLDALRVDGHLYALPEDTAQYGLYFNKSIFDAYNAEHPDAPLAYPTADWTWDDLRSAAKRLTRRDAATGAVTLSGFDVIIWEWPFLHLFLQAGGSCWSEDGLTATIDSPAGREALAFLATLMADGSWKPYFSLMGGLGPNDRFQNGQVAMYLDGSWMAPAFELNAPQLDFGVVAPPYHPPRTPGQHTIGGAVLWGISRHARHPDEAWTMLRWLVQAPQAAAYWDTLRLAPPANLDVLASPQFRSTAGIPDPGRTGGYFVPPLPAERFADRAAWMVDLLAPDPTTGTSRSLIPVAPYQGQLEEEIREMLREYLQGAAAANADPQACDTLARSLLDRTVSRVHGAIDRDRAASGLPPVPRPSP